ncbi:hypothetical protein FRX31_023664 [Thalictrum thalictroides]|uniref:Uncharacterized protein n=1 Tax=Thalictrum thalictroides TaxID=46969 RepID=A0A7J6VPS6_THATH|nr:hypothetical protein FRX31_023664 [Thalictrum thalictroides]
MEGSAHGIDTSSPANPVLATKVPKKLKGVNVRDSIISTDSDKPSDGTTESSDAIPKLNCWSHWDRKLMEANMNPERLKRIFDNRKAAKKFINKKADYSTKLKAQIMEFEGITYRLKIQVAMAMEAYMKQQKENHDMKMRVAVLELEEANEPYSRTPIGTFKTTILWLMPEFLEPNRSDVIVLVMVARIPEQTPKMAVLMYKQRLFTSRRRKKDPVMNTIKTTIDAGLGNMFLSLQKNDRKRI